MDKKQVQEHEEATRVKTIDFVQVGFTNERLKAWYYSPFPAAFHCDTLYVCDVCLAFYTERHQLKEHKRRCIWKEPPGDEIYRDGDISVFELDGRIQRTFCENLSLVAKLFLDHKTLRFDCEPFHFYVLTERKPIIKSVTEVGKTNEDIEYSHHFCGYFSKEKGWSVENNLSCILIMPYCQRKGYGKFLIEFSYELSIKEGRTGTPERPLSDLGFRTYISWWAMRILTLLLENQQAQQISISEISEQTAIDVNDVLYVLENF